MRNTITSALVIFIMLASIALAQLFGTANEPKPHHNEAGVGCVDCHGTDDPLDGAEEPACLECHGSREDVAALTKELDPNPHFGHEDGLACKVCHREHEKSVLYCDDCHMWGYTTP